MIGVTEFTDWPAEARQRPSIGGIVNPSIERLVSLGPDLVIATREANHMDTIDELVRLGLPVFVIDPQGLAGILESARQIGRALNRSGDADRLVDRLRARRDGVITRVRGLARPAVLLVIWPDPVTTIGRDSFITDIINAAGGQSVPRISSSSTRGSALKRSCDGIPIGCCSPQTAISRSRSLTSRSTPAGTGLKPSAVIVFSTTTNAWTIPARVRSTPLKTSPSNCMRTRFRGRNPDQKSPDADRT